MTKPMPLSFSRLSTFEQCEAKFDYLYVSKRVQDQQNEASAYGDRVHQILEARGKGKLDEFNLTEEGRATLAKWGPLVDRISCREGEKFYEYQMAVNADLKPVDWFAADVWIRSIADVLVVNGGTAYCLDYKGLPLDTRLPTPSGWTTMRDVQFGDTLFAESGEQCTVLGKSEIKHLRCYRIDFDDRSSVVCDEEHLWKLYDGRVVRVDALAPNDKIAVAAPLAMEDASLPLDPYVFGLWLADGKHSSGEISKPDEFVWQEIQRRGYAVNMDSGGRKSCPTRTVQGLRGLLRDLGLLGVQSKRIPQQYLRAGYAQRLDLLRGLMDGDGSVNTTRKQCVYSTTNEALAEDVCELLRTLGQRPHKSSVIAHGFGRDVAAYPVSFRPVCVNPFLLPRKRDRVGAWGAGKSAVRRVVQVTEVASVPTQCIKVNSPDSTFLCTEHMIPTHNTGKVKDNPTQLQLFAAMTMWHFPQVNKVKTSYVWLAYDQITNATYERRFLEALWNALKPRFVRVQETIDMGVFKAKPSGLCPWCPAKDICPDAKLKGRR